MEINSVFYCFTNNLCFTIYFYVKKSYFYVYARQPYNVHATLAQILPILA